MKTLVIVESPAKAKTIEKYLGSEYKVIASVGHIRDLPKSDKDAIDMENGFKPNYIISKGKEKIVKEIISEAKKVDKVLLATDPDREGEAIAWHIQEAANLKGAKRIVFNEITEEAVIQAIKEPREIDYNLKKAQEARRVLDRLFGYTLSKLIWTKVRYGLSAGRVQSPALRILMEREREIQKFIPVKFWEITAVFKRKDGSEHLAQCETTLEDEKKVKEIIKESPKAKWIIEKVKETEQLRNPKPPFITSTLQQAANSYLSWSPSNTMRVAQRLYEAGHITYMRTDSVKLADQAHKQIKVYVESRFDKKDYQKTNYATKSKSAQEAHEAIRPSNIEKSIAGENKEQKELYELIHKRTLSSQMVAAKLMRTNISFKSDNKDLPKFNIKGSRILYEGWMKADPYSKSKEVILPIFTEKEDVDCKEVGSLEKETTHPQRYSEAGLVKELEERGIGRPSTYASTIRTLQERNYVEKLNRSLKPTTLGDVVSSFVEKNFTEYIEDSFTAKIEDQLDEIAEGKKEYEPTLREFFTPFKKAVEAKKDIEKITTLGEAPEEFKCPKCGAGMVFKLAKTDTFMSCERFPDCLGGRTNEGKELKEPEKIGKPCPKCGEDLVRREGRFGEFISCSGYPKCKHVEEDEASKAKKDTGVACPECKEGSILERMGRFGTFYSCSEYPTCKYAIKAKPTGEKCPECSSLMMEGTKTIPNRCSVKTCPMHNPHKLEK